MRYLWYLAALLGALAGLVLFITSGGRGKLPSLKKDFRRINAEADAKKLVAKKGHDEALRAIEEKHKEALDGLDSEQKEEADRLRRDPVALSKYLADLAG